MFSGMKSTKWNVLCLSAALLSSSLASKAEALTVDFRTDETGTFKGMSQWGLGWLGNTSNFVSRMGGAQNIDYVRIGCPKEWALDANDALVADAKSDIDNQMNSVLLVTNVNPNTTVGLVCSGGNGINTWYVQSDGINIRGIRWLKLFKAVVNYIDSQYGLSIGFIEVANEQDFNNKIGTKENIANIMERFQNDSQVGSIPLVGPSTLATGAALKWYTPAKAFTDWGATHIINGSGQNYIDFVQTVRNDGKEYYGSEVHQLVEMIIAEEYGALGGTWWPYSVGVTEGLFVQYSQQGNRVFYAEQASGITATSGYRSADNQKIYIFAASKGGETFTYNVTDRSDVYFNGTGPQTSFTTGQVTGSELIEVTWGSAGSTGSGGTGGTGAAFGIDSNGMLYHEDNNWTANFVYLCLNGNCQTPTLNGGRYERSVSVSPGVSYSIEFKVQDNTTGQCLSGVRTVSYASGGVTASSDCD